MDPASSPLLLLQLPPEALENVLLWIEPTDLVLAEYVKEGDESEHESEGDDSEPDSEDDSGGGGGSILRASCSIPLASTCQTLRDLLLHSGDGGTQSAAPLIHRIVARGLGGAQARAVLRCLPDGSDPRIALRLAATWSRVRSACETTEELPQEHRLRPLALLPLVASTSDHNYEVIQQTVKPPMPPRRFQRSEYWSSVSQQAETRDFLVYRLPGLCALSTVRIKAYQEQGVVFAWPRVRMHVFASLPCPGEAAEPLFHTAELSAVDTSGYQQMTFAQPVIGRYLLIEMIGKCRQQHQDTGWFICVDHVTASGHQLLRAEGVVAPPPLPVACRTATTAGRRVEVLGYSQEKMLYGTVEKGAAASRFHPENAPKPTFVSPDEIMFSAEGEAARVLVEEWLGKEARAASVHKAAGGAAFKQEDFESAVASYSAALQTLWPSSAAAAAAAGPINTAADDAASGGDGADTDGAAAKSCIRQASGLHWVRGAPALHTDSLAVTLLSNRAESKLRAVRKTAAFFEFSLCLSRACLGKMIVFIYEWLKNAVFRRRIRLQQRFVNACRIVIDHRPVRKTRRRSSWVRSWVRVGGAATLPIAKLHRRCYRPLCRNVTTSCRCQHWQMLPLRWMSAWTVACGRTATISARRAGAG